MGTFGLHKAFRIEHTEEGAQIVPITKIAHVHLDDLVGYDIAKKKLIDNTEAFVNTFLYHNKTQKTGIERVFSCWVVQTGTAP